MKKDLLLHFCCGPCACYPVEVFRSEGFNVSAYWYNPNIHPLQEKNERLNAVKNFTEKKEIQLVSDDEYDLDLWLEEVRPGQTTGIKEDRCVSCYTMRMDRTAAKAKKNGIARFSTTLLYSRFQFHDRIKLIGEKIQEKHDVEFIYRDLRIGWNEGIQISKEMGLYRQKYCGCIFSLDNV
jgi:predicted adenine nucleotide alpha hydrolase (AANH) superfamily ATPase